MSNTRATEDSPKKGDASSISDEKQVSTPPIVVSDTRRRHVLTTRTKISAIFTVIFSGIALCSDGYQVQVIGYINLILAKIFPKNVFTSIIQTRLNNSFLIGEIFGQIFFGAFIDRIGRKAGVMMTTGLLVLGIILSGAAHGKTAEGLLWMLIIARGISGVGAGGEYPVCGTCSIEAADETPYVRKNRGFLIATVGNTAITFGGVVAGIVPLIVLAAYGYTNSTTSTKGFNGIWRISFVLGIIPPLSVLYFRIKMFNSTAFRNHAMKNGLLTFKVYMLAFKCYWKRIIGTCLCWFLFDFTIYPFGLFAPTIVAQINPENTLIQNARPSFIGWATLIKAFNIPGCLIGGYLMDKIGRRYTQLAGFFAQGVIGMILGGALGPIRKNNAAFIILYGIFGATASAGPGVATIILSGEVFPTPIRGTMFGWAAAWGKVGASIGTQVFTPIQDAFSDEFKGQQGVFLIGSAISILGGIATYFLIPDMSLELEDEDVVWRRYLEANGVSTVNMGEALEKSASSRIKADVMALDS